MIPVGYRKAHIASILSWGSYILVELVGNFYERPKPGSFFMLRDPDFSFHLSRPFSVFSWSSGRVSFLIKVVGRFTKMLSRKSVGDPLFVMGPLGKGFPERDGSLLVAGGMGVAPLYYLFSSLRNRKSDCVFAWGIRSGDDLIPWLDVGFIHLATEDGSFGTRGTVLDLISDFDLSKFSCILSCGPAGMVDGLRAVLPKNVLDKTYVSLEERMGCGLGLCYGCSVMTRSGPKRVCVDGPVFPLKEIV